VNPTCFTLFGTKRGANVIMMRRRSSIARCAVASAIALLCEAPGALAQPATTPTGAPAAQESGAPPQNPGEKSDKGDKHDMDTPAGTPTMQIRGFTDISYRTVSGEDTPSSFALGQFDMFFSSRLADDINFVSEVVFEANDANAVGVDVERMLLQFSPRDYFNIAAGRYHTAIGYYNVTYHHGNWFQTAIGRPIIFRFEDEDGILPVHGVGVTVHGRIPSGRAGLGYTAEIGNGRRWRTGEEAVQNVADENDHKAFNLALMARPDWLTGLQAGFSVYRDRLASDARPAVDETIMAAHVVYQNPDFESLNEAIFIRHALEDVARAFTTTSVYTQISMRFEKYRPYFRYEYLDAPSDDPIFTNVGQVYGPSIGLRYDVAEPAALKFQYDHLARRPGNTTDRLTVQLSFTF
jgi:hypothetical protein